MGKRKVIELNIHQEFGTNRYLLDSQDIYNYIGEETVEELDLAYYIDKWCQYLNRPFTHSSPVHGDVEGTALRNWINGYNYAKHIQEQEFGDRYILTIGTKFIVTIHKPRNDKNETIHNILR